MAKQQRLLREVNVPSGQFNMTHQELHDVVTVFDGGCYNNLLCFLAVDGADDALGVWLCFSLLFLSLFAS